MSQNKRIRLLIVNGHPGARRGLSELFGNAADIELVGAAGSGDDGVRLAAERKPDVVLLDVPAPVDGVDAMQRLLASAPQSRVVILASSADHELVMSSFDSGAVGYLLEDSEAAELIGGVRAAARGETPLSPRAARALLASHSGQHTAAQLTDRELQVLRLVGAGLANKQIASRLDISEKTVKAHLTNVFRAIDVHDRTQAALWAQRHGVS